MFVGTILNRSGQFFEVKNPYKVEVVGLASRDSHYDAEYAIKVAKTYDHRLSSTDRSKVLRNTAEELLKKKEDFALLATQETGICIKDTRNEVDRAYQNLVVASEEAKRIGGDCLPIVAGQTTKLAWTLREPVGLVCAITPFNRPLNQTVVKVAPAIAANNSVVLKPSEKAPLTALAFANLLIKNGLPESMLTVVTGYPHDIGEILLSHPLIDMVTFTGGVSTGERIVQQTGLKKLLLELGGNDPLIVLDDADLEKAAKIATEGAFVTSGQSCRGIKRIIVMKDIADQFVIRLVRETEGKKWGDPLDPETDVGTVIDEEAAINIENRCMDAVKDGAKILCGGERRGAAFSPTVLDYVQPTSTLVACETFGPVAPVIRVDNVSEAIEIANGTVYGLQAGVVTRDFENFLYIAKNLRVGGVGLMEGPNFDSPFIPFGGVKKSGIGREGIRYAIGEMTVTKTVVVPW